MNGFLLIDKPAGVTSHDVVYACRRTLKTKKVGHTGTLDPFATGLLVVGIGEALKFLQYLKEEPKVYEATLKLGSATDTLDCDGKVVEIREVPLLDLPSVARVLQTFVGRQKQIPPMFSAKKQAGKKLYELARAGVEVERQPVEIEVFAIQDIRILASDQIFFRVSVSRGTYVRSLAADMALALGSVGHLTALRRVQSGFFRIDGASPFPPQTSAEILPPESALTHYPALDLTKEQARDIGHGKSVAYILTGSPYFFLKGPSGFLGLGRGTEGRLKAERLLSASQSDI